MSKVFLSPEASRDLAQIKQYIALELKNPAAAGRIVAAILKELRTLERFPAQGPSVEALTGFPSELRLLLCGKHIALYKVENDTVFVARIIDPRQDYLRLLFGEYMDTLPQ